MSSRFSVICPSMAFAGSALLLLIISASGCGMRDGGQLRQDKSKILKTEQDFRDRLAEIRMQRHKVQRHVDQLEKRKRETVDYLREKGVNSSADLNLDDNDIKYALRHLKQSKASIDNLNQDLTHYDQAISSIQAMLDDMERKAIADSVALSEDDFIELRKIVVDLNEQLDIDTDDPLEDAQLAELVDSELLADTPKSPGKSD